MSKCIADDARVPVRATYVNLYKWPDSDREFVRSVSRNSNRGEHCEKSQCHPRLVDSISCRQLYLKSYTFSREESLNERTMKCIGRVKEKAGVGRKRGKSPASGDGGGRRRDGGKRRRKKKCTMVVKVKEVSYATLASIFRRLLSCTTKVDVVD